MEEIILTVEQEQEFSNGKGEEEKGEETDEQ